MADPAAVPPVGLPSGPEAGGPPRRTPLPADPPPEGFGLERSATGHPEVDAALDRLAALDGVPTAGHLAVYENVHQRLSSVLAALDTPSGPVQPAVAAPANPQ